MLFAPVVFEENLVRARDETVGHLCRESFTGQDIGLSYRARGFEPALPAVPA